MRGRKLLLRSLTQKPYFAAPKSLL